VYLRLNIGNRQQLWQAVGRTGCYDNGKCEQGWSFYYSILKFMGLLVDPTARREHSGVRGPQFDNPWDKNLKI